MKWFFALNEAGNQFQRYSEMVRVAVHTALHHTDLHPHFIYDGGENDLTRWLRARGVVVIPCRSGLYNDLHALAARWGDPGYAAIGAGAFLRCEIAALAPTLGIDDDWVLYTDCDVMFTGPVDDLLRDLRPRWFAVAPEDPARPRWINSGVMLMNLRSLRAVDRRFRAFARRHLEAFARGTWDQDAFREYFVRGPRAVGEGWLARRLRNYSHPRWDSLPLELNWRPYWGRGRDVRIVHFHGPKPYQRLDLLGPQTPSHLVGLRPLAGGEYPALADAWGHALAEAAGPLKSGLSA